MDGKRQRVNKRPPTDECRTGDAPGRWMFHHSIYPDFPGEPLVWRPYNCHYNLVGGLRLKECLTRIGTTMTFGESTLNQIHDAMQLHMNESGYYWRAAQAGERRAQVPSRRRVHRCASVGAECCVVLCSPNAGRRGSSLPTRRCTRDCTRRCEHPRRKRMTHQHPPCTPLKPRQGALCFPDRCPSPCALTPNSRLSMQLYGTEQHGTSVMLSGGTDELLSVNPDVLVILQGANDPARDSLANYESRFKELVGARRQPASTPLPASPLGKSH